MSGRPLRFLGMTLGGWVAIRVMLLLPGIDSLPELIEVIAPPLDAADLAPPRVVAPMPATTIAMPWRATRPAVAASITARRTVIAEDIAANAAVSPGAFVPDTAMIVMPIPVSLPAGTSSPPGRWSGSAWLLARGGADGTLSGGRLGASQAGARLVYALDAANRFGIAARIATPLEGAGREVAMGVQWQPLDLPVRLIAEQRFAIDGGRGGPTAMIVGGYGPAPVVGSIRLEAYGQAGGIARDGVEGFADGAARLTRSLATSGRIRVDLGIGGWGAVQRDAARLDVGPTIGVAVPARFTTLRVNADWRQRIAGRARPASGPALSIGADF